MSEWRERLRAFDDLGPNEDVYLRAQEGPQRGELPDGPSGPKRLAAGAVAFAVFAAAAVFGWQAFHSGDREPIGPTGSAATVNLASTEDGPSATLSYGGLVQDGVFERYVWCSGSDNCTAGTGEFQYPLIDEGLAIPAGSPIEFEGDGRVERFVIRTTEGDRASPNVIVDTDGTGASVPDEPGDYLLWVAADWDQGSGAFYLRVRATASPTSAAADNGAIAFSFGSDADIGVIEGLAEPADAARAIVERHAGGQEGGVGFAWSPDGTRLAYTDYRGDGTRGLFVVDPATGESIDLSSSLELADTIAWSRDGSHLAFGGCCDAGYQIYVVSVDGTTLRQVSDVDDDGVSGATMPAWSPDGNDLAWVLTDYDEATTEETSKIVMSDIDGGNVVEIVGTSDALESPAFSPDGSMLSFLHKGGRAYPDLNVVRIDGDAGLDPSRLTDAAIRLTSIPRWHPDSQSLVFAAQEVSTDNYGLYRVNVASGELSILLQDAYIGSPTWSPDGATIAFVRDDAGSGRFAIAKMDVPGQRTVDLVDELTEAGPIDWQPVPR